MRFKIVSTTAVYVAALCMSDGAAWSADYIINSFTNQPINLSSNSLTVTSSGSIVFPGYVILNNSNGLFLSNAGTITGYTTSFVNNANIYISNSTLNGSIVNSGIISNAASDVSVFRVRSNAIINGSIINTGTLQASGADSHVIAFSGGADITGGIINAGTIRNNGSASTVAYSGIRVGSGSLIKGGITNIGLINSINGTGIYNSGSIEHITNMGSITGGSAGIENQFGFGEIFALSNLQGAGNLNGALVYKGKLPENYNLIIDRSNYGQLSANTISGSMNFSVTGDTRFFVPQKKYTSVLSGITSSNLNNFSGKVGDRGTFTLRQNGANTWDMTIDGLWTPVIGYMNPNVANTYTAVSANRDAVSGALHQRYAVLNAVMEYDCSRFDRYGVCLSFQARAIGWGDQTTGAGVLNIAKRITENVRAGVYLDYQAAQATPYATNSFTGGIQWGYNNPTFGGYVGWSDKADGTGIQARVSGGYNPGKITVNRAILDYAEPGSGTAGLNAYYAYGVAGYGLSVGNGVLITPYGGLRYTDVTRNAYTENFVPGMVLFPLAYNAYYEQLITGLTGAKVQAMLTEKFGVNLAFGGEFDFNRNANGYGGYSYAPGMEAWGVNHGGSWNGVRPAGIIGAFYDVNKNDRLLLNAYVGEQAWSTRAYTSLLAGYQVAF